MTDQGRPIGTHPLVVRFLKGVYQTRPSLPRCAVTWDTDVLLQHLKRLSPVKRLTLKDLTFKLVALIAILSGQRIQSIQLLDVRNMSLSKSKCKFRIGDLVKTSRPGKHVNEIILPAYAPDRRLCIVTVLSEYLKRTESLRGQQTRLLLSFTKPHNCVTRDTISRWIRTVFNKSWYRHVYLYTS